ncbi:uncharacterized protein LOC135476463 [Liolophura sinensis]|uniref:uncharacterized protein LOC135476463 n=1 Tax=Liolophura sinensis TaxID=3198878 RepID=UPI00315815CA
MAGSHDQRVSEFRQHAVILRRKKKLYQALEGLEKGLVHGPVSESVTYAVLAFAIIGVFIFTTETVVSALKTFKGKEIDLYVDLLSAIGIWCADLPQITLNVYVAACREELVSNVQIAKGAVILVAACIRFVIVLIRWKRLSDSGWAKITNVPFLRMSNEDVFVRYEILGTSEDTWLLSKEITQKQNVLDKECYNLTLLNNDSFVESHELLVSTCLNLHTSENTTVFVFRFHFIKPIHGFFSNSKIFGDISFNVKPDIMGPNVTSTRGQRELTDIPVNPVRYFRYFSNSGNVVHQTSLTDIKDVWSTGYYQCESTGNLYPTRDTTLKIDIGDL